MTAPLAVAEALVARRLGRAVRLETPTLLKSWARNDVWRARVAGDGAPWASVIIKRFKSEPARGFDEWAALELLTDRSPRPAIAPAFVGGDMAAHCFVMEDLGVAPSLEGVLEAKGARAGADAASALMEVARVTARFHVTMRGPAAEFDRRRDALAPRPRPAVAEAAYWLRRRGDDLAAWLAAVGEALPGPPHEAIATVADLVEAPGQWTTLTHGDMAPSNTLRTADGWRLLDFEYAGVRSALYDTLLWTLFCPFPADLVARADAEYRKVLQDDFPAAADDRAYATARARVAAWRMLDLLHWQPPALLEADRDWAPGMSARGAVRWHLARFHAVAADAPDAAGLGPIVAATRALERGLRARWGDTPDAASVWPAFAADRL